MFEDDNLKKLNGGSKMLIEDKTGFKVNLQVFNDGEEITEEFFEEFVEKKENNTLFVDQSVECIMKMMRFLNRLGEYSNIELTSEDYAIINGKKFSCMNEKTRQKIN